MQINTGNEHNNLCVGIDLGTTNSVVSIINEKAKGGIVSKVVEIPRAVDIYSTLSSEAKLTTMKKTTLPSCVYYRQEKNYEPLVGDFAKMQYSLRPHLVARSIKSQMGRPMAEGLSPDIPDKTPAEISARTLTHILKEVSRIYRMPITDAVITVPANFDSAMCKATRDAAKLAGIKVENADGTERPVLLSEPNAVIYDLINQIQNDEISGCLLDLSEKKRVLVFDLGGGTLDITIHEIMRREDAEDALKVAEIATNRFTMLGGDDFDEAIAEAMYERYLNQYARHPEVVRKLRQEKNVIMPQMRVYAEHLKLDLNERCGNDYCSGWDDEDVIELTTGGNMGGIGYSYDDTFTQEEIENILSVFMASELKYHDYKHIEKIKNTDNIIYPVLDVLKKASEKLGEENVVIDAVVVNGGMSKFYMVTERLEEFFGFEPIVALDPDLAVARGASVYHYYLHKYDELKDDMKLLGEEADRMDEDPYYHKRDREAYGQRAVSRPAVPQMAIQWGNNILNDSLYLGVKNGAVCMIIPTGAELPYTSSLMTGFRIEADQQMVAIPIKSRNLDGTYRTIASGNISFKRKYSNGAYVAFMIHMSSSKVISMKAWTSKDPNGIEKIEEGYVEIAIDNGGSTKIKTKFVAPSGSVLQPNAEINNLLQLCRNFENSKPQMKSKAAKKLAEAVTNISNAGNKEAFAPVILEALMSTASEEARNRLFFLARKIGFSWKESDRKKLTSICMNQLSAELHGLSMGGGPRVSTNIQAIFALSVDADEEQLEKLKSLHENQRYLQACIYIHAKTRTALEWLQEQFEKDAELVKNRRGSNIQFSSYAIGAALRQNGERVVAEETERRIVNELCAVINTGNLSCEELTCCILALGWICDQRERSSVLGSEMICQVIDTIEEVDQVYTVVISMKQNKAREIAFKMINGDLLTNDQEQFLLTKLDM